LAFSPDGKWLGVGGYELILLDTTGGQPASELSLDDPIWKFAFIRGGEAILCMQHASKKWLVYNLATGKQRTRKCETTCAAEMVSDREGKTVYLCGDAPDDSKGSAIWRVSVSDLNEWKAFGKVTDWLRYLAISADGSRLAARGVDSVRVWDNADEKLPDRPKINVKLRGAVASFALTHDGKLLAIADSYGLTLWSTGNGKQVVRSGQHRRCVTGVACSPTRPLIVTGDNAGNIFVWDTTGRVLKRYAWGLDIVRMITFDHEGLRVAAADIRGKVVVWDVDV
jgi:WD40 repeat protein